MADADLIRPVKPTPINDDFAAHVKRGAASPGLDYNCPVGQSVWASDRGVVIAASNNPNSGAGKHVIIRHRDGSQTFYYHLSQVFVGNGTRVNRRDEIGKSGNTGTQTTGPHLHFAIKDGKGRFVDPEKVFAREKRERSKEHAAKKAAELAVDTMTPTHEIIPE
jgi:murein DD-endopeptidase MepM/ murein hydrolase activator NlpD